MRRQVTKRLGWALWVGAVLGCAAGCGEKRSYQDYIPADSAMQVIPAGGVGKFNAIDLRKFMSGKVASANPFISEIQEGLTGSSSRRDMETMFQLIYLRFTQPRADATAFNVQANQAKAFLVNQSAVPDFAFFNALTTTRYQNHLRRRPDTVETIDAWNLDKSLAFYKDRFADARFDPNPSPGVSRPHA